MSHTFSSPACIVTGIGCFDQIAEHIAPLGNHCLIVTGEKSMQEQGIFDKALKLLNDRGVKTSACVGVEHDPSVQTVDRAREAIRKTGADVVLGLGGGSAIDVAKAAAGLAETDKPTVAFFDGEPVPGSRVPVVAAPSTFGTGTEATRVSVLSDRERRQKKSIRHDDMLPRVAIVDPVLGAGAPPRLTAACGMDALTQAIESYLSRHASDLTRAMSFSALMLLITGLPRAVEDGHDITARESCANGSLMAGIALHNARLGLVHGLAHPLGARYGIAHGEVCGILLPHVLRYNREAESEGYALLSGILGRDIADVCQEMLEQLGLPHDLTHLGVPEADITALVEATMPSGSTQANPRRVTEEDVERLLRSVCFG